MTSIYTGVITTLTAIFKKWGGWVDFIFRIPCSSVLLIKIHAMKLLFLYEYLQEV